MFGLEKSACRVRRVDRAKKACSFYPQPRSRRHALGVGREGHRSLSPSRRSRGLPKRGSDRDPPHSLDRLSTLFYSPLWRCGRNAQVTPSYGKWLKSLDRITVSNGPSLTDPTGARRAGGEKVDVRRGQLREERLGVVGFLRVTRRCPTALGTLGSEHRATRPRRRTSAFAFPADVEITTRRGHASPSQPAIAARHRESRPARRTRVGPRVARSESQPRSQIHSDRARSSWHS